MSKQFVMVGTDKFEYDPTALGLDNTRESVDDTLCNQAEMFFHVSFWAGKARTLVDRLSAEIKIKEAELDEVIRKMADDAGMKTTEAKVRNQILASDLYKGFSKQLQDATAALNTITALQQAYSQRKDCVLELARLVRADIVNSPEHRV